MKVLEIISDTNIGGAGVLLVSRLRHSDRRRVQTTVLLPRNSQLKKRFLAIGVSVLEMNGCRDRSMDIGSILKIARIIRKASPDIVHCHGCMSARIAAAMCDVPVRMYTRHCAYPVPTWQKHTVVRALQNVWCRILSHHILAVADAAKKNLMEMGIPESKISVIINGAEGLTRLSDSERRAWRERLGISEQTVVVGISARLEACKDHATLLRAAERLQQKGRDCCFLLVGDGSLRESLERDVKRRGLEHCVRFVGFVSDVTPYVNIMDIHVNCSVGTETSSLAISEAMSLGIPTIASNYGGNPYMVRDGINGLLFSAGDDLALSTQIERLLDSPALYASLSAHAYERFLRELNAEAMTKKTERLYARLYARYGCQKGNQRPSRALANWK